MQDIHPKVAICARARTQLTILLEERYVFADALETEAFPLRVENTQGTYQGPRRSCLASSIFSEGAQLARSHGKKQNKKKLEKKVK